MTRRTRCAVCEGNNSLFFRSIDGYDYFECTDCGSLHAGPELLVLMDEGRSPIGKYEHLYWEQERQAALERAAGLSLCRAGEAILYARRSVQRFLDVGAGPGFLLERLQEMLDPNASIFHAVEKFPPPYAVDNPSYHRDGIPPSLPSFDAGVCIEVVEHLTPRMLRGLLSDLANVSEQGSFWLFNTGMPDYVKNEDPGYLDPVGRGHIVSYSLRGLRPIFAESGFIVGELPGKSFAFYAEYGAAHELSFDERIYQPLAENVALLKRNELLYQAVFESARSYLYYDGYMKRTMWAKALDAELNRFRTSPLGSWFTKFRR